MDRQEMIDKIYEVIADKEPTMWCKIYDSMQDKFAHITHNNTHQQPDVIYEDWDSSYVKLHKEYIKIIWNPVMIWDVLDWIERNYDPEFCGSSHIKCNREWFITLFTVQKQTTTLILKKREHKRKPIEWQSDDCITFIHSLLPND